jgi:hypothetical protein
VFEQAGVFDSCWLLSADYDMWWRIVYNFPAIGYLPEPLAIVHLDALDAAARARRVTGKRGEDARKLVNRHLKLAEENGALAEFKPLAKKVMKKSLISTVFNGFKNDARETIRQFSDLFPRSWRFSAYLLTIFPGVTAFTARKILRLGLALKLDRQVTRRQAYSE